MSESPLRQFGNAVERLVGNRTYLRVQRVVLVATVVLLAANALVQLEVVALDAALADALWDVGMVAVALFVLTGVLQVVALGRSFDRGRARVQEAADELETTAADVERTADELEETAETVESAAEEVEQVGSKVGTAAESIDEVASEADVDPPVDPDEVKSVADEVDETTERVREQSSEVKERSKDIKDKTESAKEAAKGARAATGAEYDFTETDTEGPERRRGEAERHTDDQSEESPSEDDPDGDEADDGEAEKEVGERERDDG